MVMGGDSRSWVSNPSAVYWMDILHIKFLYKCNDVCLKKTENKRKRGRDGPCKKKLDIETMSALAWS